ncbi:MarR family transcriptional regulator [Saccharopolyspora sp. NPDC049357]|uniref:MarR family winged helix-turn-helix transcriptional regulator n=1 Tax=Saccharopolyspora sp. NPDC049357 TaxID=3154507 RepID=UPI0034441DAD
MPTSSAAAVEFTPARPRATYLVKRLEQAVRSHLDEATMEIGLTTPQYAALSSLDSKPGLSSAELARLSFISAQAMNQMVGAMERKGLIRREAASHHRKQLRIFLTDHGRECLRQCDDRADELERRMFADLSEAEQVTLVSLLRRCSDSLTAGA